MRALLLNAYGEPPSAVLGDIDAPEPRPGQVLVRVHAAGLNPIDAKLARGWMSSVMSFDLPIALGWDFAGVVERADEGSSLTDGQEIFGSLGPPTGSTAELLVADSPSPWLAAKPEGLAMTDAASIAMVGLTALTTQRTLARTGQVFVIGASGGIGAFLVPLLARAGLEVIATGTRQSVARLREAGAAEVIDYRTDDLATRLREIAPKGADAVVDLINQFDGLMATAALVRENGQLLSTLFGPDPSALADRGVELTYVRNDALDGGLEQVATLVLDGSVRPAPAEVVPFADAESAFARLEQGAHTKIVLDLRGDAS